MKSSTLGLGIVLSLSLTIASVTIFTDFGSIFMLVFLFQPLVVFFNHFKSTNPKECGGLNLTLALSNIWGAAAYKIYYEFVYKQQAHGLNWGSVLNEIGYTITFWLFIIIAAVVVLECIISFCIKAAGGRREE